MKKTLKPKTKPERQPCTDCGWPCKETSTRDEHAPDCPHWPKAPVPPNPTSLKEKIKSAISGGLFDSDSVIDALFDIVSEEQLIQNLKFSLLSGPSKSSEKPIPTSTNELEDKIKGLVPDAIFVDGKIPDCCNAGEWNRITFYKGCDRCMVFWTQNLDAFKMPELRLAMKTAGCTTLYCDPYVRGEWRASLKIYF